MITATLPPELQRVHMIGIGGAGMSGVARILLARGGEVSGSDVRDSRALVSLSARGAKVAVGHDIKNLELLSEQPSCVIVSYAAIPDTNPELREARRLGIPIRTRSQVLAQLMQGYKTLLVAGTHGKTSTTSMAVVSFQSLGCDPSFAVGGALHETGTNAHHGSGDLFIAEADESDASLLQYRASMAIVTNVEPDHLNFFGTPEAYCQVFADFLDCIDPAGSLIVCVDDPGSHTLALYAVQKGIRVLGYGTAAAAAQAQRDGIPMAGVLEAWEPTLDGLVARIHLAGDDSPRELVLPVPGEHMALNALAALIAVRDYGGDVSEALEALTHFGGVNRRFQYHGHVGGIRVYDDYAHHPTEARAVLTAAREVADADAQGLGHPGRVIVCFQPHLFSRTEQFAEEFAKALDLADYAFVLDIYGAREKPIPGVTSELITTQLTIPHKYQPDFSKVPYDVAAIAEPGDIVLTMGAGNVTMEADAVIALLKG